jgi:hypothetical protein
MVKLIFGRGEICRNAEKRQPQVADLPVAEMFGQARAYLSPVYERDKEGDVRERAGFDALRILVSGSSSDQPDRPRGR